MEPESSLLCSQEPSTGPCSEPDQSTPYSTSSILVAPTWSIEHSWNASFHFSFWIGRTRTGDQPVARPLPTQAYNKHRRLYFEWDSTHDPNVLAGEDISCIRPSLWSLSFWLFHQNHVCVLPLHSCYIPCPSYFPWREHSNCIWLSVQDMKLLTKQFSPAFFGRNTILSTLFSNTHSSC
jgi:hypothetical protein